MSNYGFSQNPVEGVKLPQPSAPKPAEASPVDIAAIVQAGSNLGFKSREGSSRRKPGPRRSEAQDKITVTGPKRVIDRLKTYCDTMGEPSYCTAIERLLDMAEKNGK